MQRAYPLTPQLLAWHEAGHVAVIENFGDPWIAAAADFQNLSGFVQTAAHQSDKSAMLFAADSAPRAVIGTAPALKAISRKVAIQFFAGVAAERACLGLPFDGQAFADQDFPDFAFARWMLSLTESDSEALYCARVACDIVASKRARIEYLAARLLEDGIITSAEDRQFLSEMKP